MEKFTNNNEKENGKEKMERVKRLLSLLGDKNKELGDHLDLMRRHINGKNIAPLDIKDIYIKIKKIQNGGESGIKLIQDSLFPEKKEAPPPTKEAKIKTPPSTADIYEGEGSDGSPHDLNKTIEMGDIDGLLAKTIAEKPSTEKTETKPEDEDDVDEIDGLLGRTIQQDIPFAPSTEETEIDPFAISGYSLSLDVRAEIERQERLFDNVINSQVADNISYKEACFGADKLESELLQPLEDMIKQISEKDVNELVINSLQGLSFSDPETLSEFII